MGEARDARLDKRRWWMDTGGEILVYVVMFPGSEANVACWRK